MKTYTTVQAAKELGVSRDTIYRWMKANSIKGARVTRFGEFQLRLWAESDLNRIRAWMAKHPHANRGKKRNKGKSKV
jgi:excisionase family DNA binding protein